MSEFARELIELFKKHDAEIEVIEGSYGGFESYYSHLRFVSPNGSFTLDGNYVNRFTLELAADDLLTENENSSEEEE